MIDLALSYYKNVFFITSGIAASLMAASSISAFWVAAYWLLESQKFLVIFQTLWTNYILALQQNSFRRNWMPEQLSGLLIYATSTPLWLLRLVKVSTGSEIYPNYFWLPTFCNCSQFFDSPSFSKHIQLGYLWLPTSPFVTPLLPTGHHVMPTATKYFPSNPYLGKQIISLGVPITLSTSFWSHT